MAPGRSLDELIDRTPDLPWLTKAACGDLELDQLDLFFVEAGRTIASSTVALCQKCPVRRECLDHAYRHEIMSGYFGGMSPGRRRVLSHETAVAEIEREIALRSGHRDAARG
ncbi:MAG: WhiB family transcriptional regulator [Actinomycetota bacterium]|jgi:WhiB family redox-sensing transcriptional regulator